MPQRETRIGAISLVKLILLAGFENGFESPESFGGDFGLAVEPNGEPELDELSGLFREPNGLTESDGLSAGGLLVDPKGEPER